MIREVRREREGAAHGECGCSLLRVRSWWMLTMNSHGVEISIAGCIGVMVCDPNHMPFLFFFSCALYYQLLGTKTAWSASHGKAKTPSPNYIHPGAREKAINLSRYGMGPTTHRLRKFRNQTLTKEAEQENQINTWGGINRNTPFVDTNDKNKQFL